MTHGKAQLRLEELESRLVPSTFAGTTPPVPSPAVQADLAKIKADQQQLNNDLKTLGPTIHKDEQAVQAAIQAAIKNDTAVQAAQTALTNDVQTWQTRLMADWKAIGSAADANARSAAIAQFKTDLSSAYKAIEADRAKVQAAIDADTAVAAAKAQLKTDSAPITTDRANLEADYAQLRKDLQAQGSTGTTP